MTQAKKKPMTRKEAEAMYADLRKAMAGKLAGASAQAKGGKSANSSIAAEIAKSIKAAIAEEDRQNGAAPRVDTAAAPSTALPAVTAAARGARLALSMVVFCALFKLTLSALEVAGVLKVDTALASLAKPAAESAFKLPEGPRPVNQTFSSEEVQILTSLDGRRVELEERNKRLDQREADMEKRDAEFATRITQLRELTEKLRTQRESDDKKREGQYDQLANVYGSMDPKEAAALIEQLDVTIALKMISRMPEKRIAQILALMNPQKALSLTRMLTAGK